MPDRSVALGPAGSLALIVGALALVRRSRRLGAVAGALLAVELVPPYRRVVAAKAQSLKERAETVAAPPG